MFVADLRAALTSDISDTQKWLIDLRQEVVAAENRLADFQLELRSLDSAVARYDGNSRPASTETDPSWITLTRVDAIERVLRESGPLHLTEIQTLLTKVGRMRDSVAEVSSTVSYLGRKRQTVIAIGHGRWDYVRQVEGSGGEG